MGSFFSLGSGFRLYIWADENDVVGVMIILFFSFFLSMERFREPFFACLLV